MLVKIVEDELRDLMGGEVASFQITGSPAVILIAGLQGSGKTTFTQTCTLGKIQKRKIAINGLPVTCIDQQPSISLRA